MNPLSEFFINMNEPKQFGVIGPGFLNQVPTLHPTLKPLSTLKPGRYTLKPFTPGRVSGPSSMGPTRKMGVSENRGP